MPTVFRSSTSSAFVHTTRASGAADLGTGFATGVSRGLATALATGLIATLLLGCEHGGARAEQSVQDEIEAVASDVARTRAAVSHAPDADTGAKLHADLGNHASRLEQLTSGTPGQKAAASLLAAHVKLDMGRLAADRLQQVEGELRQDRNSLSGLIDAAVVLDVLATAGERFDPTTDQRTLESLRAEAARRIETLRGRINELEQPMAQITADSDASRAAAQQLERDEQALRQQARSAGHSAGFKYVEQAAEKRDALDALRVKIARNDLQLSELAPEKEMATVDVAQQQAMIEAMKAAETDLGRSAEEARAIAQESRERLAEVRSEVTKGLEAIESQRKSSVVSLLAQADEDFNKAAQLASRSGGDASARLTAATAQQSLAKLHWNHALSLRDHALFVNRLRDGGSVLGDPTALGALSTAIETERTESIEKAKTAATAALEQLGSLSSERPETTQLKANLTALIDQLSGKDAVVQGSGAGAAGAGIAAGPAPTFATPQAVVDFLKSPAASGPTGYVAVLNAMRASSPTSKQLLAYFKVTMEDSAELVVAMHEKFGADAASGASPIGGAWPEGERLALGEVTESRANVNDAGAATNPAIVLVRAAGQWWIDADHVFKSVPPELTSQVAMMAPMMEQIRPAVRAAASEVAAQVRSGAITSPEAVQAALMQAVMQKMMGGAGLDPAMIEEQMKKAMDAGVVPEK